MGEKQIGFIVYKKDSPHMPYFSAHALVTRVFYDISSMMCPKSFEEKVKEYLQKEGYTILLEVEYEPYERTISYNETCYRSRIIEDKE